MLCFLDLYTVHDLTPPVKLRFLINRIFQTIKSKEGRLLSWLEKNTNTGRYGYEIYLLLSIHRVLYNTSSRQNQQFKKKVKVENRNKLG